MIFLLASGMFEAGPVGRLRLDLRLRWWRFEVLRLELQFERVSEERSSVWSILRLELQIERVLEVRTSV
jgi:hypothetical protein